MSRRATGTSPSRLLASARPWWPRISRRRWSSSAEPGPALGLAIEWREADAEQLPFPDERFDVVASVFGAMFAPDPDRVATELFRVAKRGGLVAMANYGPKGFLGRFTALLAEFAPPPPPGMHSPFEWGVTDEVHRRFKGLTSSIEIYPQALTFEFESTRRRMGVLGAGKPATAGDAEHARRRKDGNIP